MEKAMDFVKKNSKVIGLACAAVLLISVFLPFAKVSVSILGYTASESVKFIEGWEGKFVLLAAIAIGVLVYLNKNRFIVAPTAAALLVTIYAMIDVRSEDVGNIAKVSCGLGFFVAIIACLALGFFIYVDYANLKKEKKISFIDYANVNKDI